MSRRQKAVAQIFRWLCYWAWSYVWIGAMFLLMIRQITPYLWMGLCAALFFFGTAKKYDPRAFTEKRGNAPVRLSVMAAFVLFQFLCWRYFYFFRDPERPVPSRAALVSPADGFVVYVRAVKSGRAPLAVKENKTVPLEEVLRTGKAAGFDDGTLLGIFMTPMSVHVNRAPISGTISQRFYFRGTDVKSMMPMSLRTMFHRLPYEKGSKHILTNERETLLIVGDFPVFLTRIADPYVNKIVTWKREGEKVAQGERIGLIKMGSQADLFFPAQVNGRPLRVLVKEGDYVYGGSTALAAY